MILLAADINSVKDHKSFLVFSAKVQLILGELDWTWYATRWSNIAVMNTLKAAAEGSLFDRGNGAERIKAYNISVKDQPDVWMGTQNRETLEHQIWCTKRKEECTMKLKGAKYLNGNVGKITEAAIASCSVPTLVPCVKIGHYHFRDGGVRFASPLGDCLPVFNTALHKGKIPYKIVYISPNRYSEKEDKLSDKVEDDDVWNKISASFAGMATNIHMMDRNNGIRAVTADKRAVTEIGRGVNCLMKALEIQERAEMSIIELVMLDPVYTNFLTMHKGLALERFLEASKREYQVRHDYVLPLAN